MYDRTGSQKQYPSLVIASFGANRKDKPEGQIAARVLFDGTHGLEVGGEQEDPGPGPGTQRQSLQT